MEFNEILKMYNYEGLTLVEIGKKIGKSKSSVYRLFSSSGYVLNKKTGKYESDETNVSRETINNENNKTNVSFETMVARTYNIDSKMDKAIRIKAAIEGIKSTDIVREALKAYVEPKYLDM